MLESRPELETTEVIRAFRPLRDLVDSGFEPRAVEEIVGSASSGSVRAVVVDLRHSKYLSTAAVLDLVAMRRRLAVHPCWLALLVENPSLRQSLTGGGFPRFALLAGSPAELAEGL